MCWAHGFIYLLNVENETMYPRQAYDEMAVSVYEVSIANTLGPLHHTTLDSEKLTQHCSVDETARQDHSYQVLDDQSLCLGLGLVIECCSN